MNSRIVNFAGSIGKVPDWQVTKTGNLPALVFIQETFLWLVLLYLFTKVWGFFFSWYAFVSHWFLSVYIGIVPEVLFIGCCFCDYVEYLHWIGGIEYYGNIICLPDAPDNLVQLGHVYCDLGYLTQSLQAHEQALHITKEFKSDKPKHQVSPTDSLMCNRYSASRDPKKRVSF